MAYALPPDFDLDDLTEGAIRKRAKRDGWEHDLGPKIRAKGGCHLVRRGSTQLGTAKMTMRTRKEIIESEALRVASGGLTQRKDITGPAPVHVLVLRTGSPDQ